MDVKQIVRQLRAKGMSDEDIKSNLAALGVQNADELLAEASGTQAKEIKLEQPPEQLTAENPEKGDEIPRFEVTSIAGGEEKTLQVGKNTPDSSFVSAGEGLISRVSSTTTGDIEQVEQKLGEILALLRALQEVNRKILETNREVLLRLKTQ